MKKKHNLLACLSAFTLLVQAQNTTLPQPLYQEIYEMDSLLFAAFNTQNVAAIGAIFSEDLEFFHDKSGLTNYEQNLVIFSENVARGNMPRRELVKGSMAVFPVPGYGAVQTGDHTFCHLENGQMDCGTFQFLHIWQYKEGEWKLARIVSYDH